MHFVKLCHNASAICYRKSTNYNQYSKVTIDVTTPVFRSSKYWDTVPWARSVPGERLFHIYLELECVLLVSSPSHSSDRWGAPTSTLQHSQNNSTYCYVISCCIRYILDEDICYENTCQCCLIQLNQFHLDQLLHNWSNVKRMLTRKL